MSLRKWFFTPSGVMWVVIAMYAVKVGLKLSLGIALDAPAIYGDGVHNISDILEAISVLIILWLASLSDERYPNGRGNIESLGVLAGGTILIGVAGNVAWESCLGIWKWYFSTPEAAETIGYSAFWWAVALYAGSAIVSVAVSRYQITVGTACNRPLVVADGDETRSDAYVELGVLVGVIGVVVFKSVLWGHLAGLLVTWKLAETGYKLIRRGLNALLQITIGLNYEKDIAALIMETPGILSVPKSRAWLVGGCVNVAAKVVLGPKVSAEAVRDLEEALRPRIAEYLRKNGMPEAEISIRFDASTPGDYRTAYPVVYDENGVARLAPLAAATHLYTCDIRRGLTTRIVEYEIPRGGIAALLKDKRVSRVIGWGPEHEENEPALPCQYQAASVPFPPLRVD